MAGTGGARPGAGRKPKRDKHATAINRAEKRIKDRLPELIDNLFELAEGIEVQERDANGATRVYSRAPDRQANEYLLNRIMGKPTERLESENKTETTHVIVSQLSAALNVSYGDASDPPHVPASVNGNGHAHSV